MRMATKKNALDRQLAPALGSDDHVRIYETLG